MRRTPLTTPAFAVAAVTLATGCSAASGGSSTSGSSSISSVSVQQASSATSSGGGTNAVVHSGVTGTSATSSGAVAREHHPVDLGDLGRLALRCEPGGRLAIGIELPPGAAAVAVQLSAGGERVERRVTGGARVWGPFARASDASAQVRRGHREATVTIAVRHTGGGCVVTSVDSAQRATP